MADPKTALFDDITEILILYPRLGPALERDQGVVDEERVSGGGAIGLPVNADVLDALRILGGDIPRITRWAVGVIAETMPGRDVGTMLQHLPRIHERMLVTAATAEAAALARDVHSVLRRVKLALGLRTVDRPLRQYCPLHDDPLHELIAPGDEGFLRYRYLDRAGQPVSPAVEWRHVDCALCRHCGAAWSPPQYLLLGKLLCEADTRRLAANTENRGAA